MELGAANYYLVACSTAVEIRRPFANQNATFKTHSQDNYVARLFDLEFQHFKNMGASKVILQPITV